MSFESEGEDEDDKILDDEDFRDDNIDLSDVVVFLDFWFEVLKVKF